MILQTLISQNNYKEGLYAANSSITWGAADTGDYPTLAGVVKTDVFTPTISLIDTYNHQPALIEHYGAGVLHTIWQSHKQNEQSSLRIFYSKSTDYGATWSSRVEIFEHQDDVDKALNLPVRQCLASGFIVIENELYAISDVNDIDDTIVDSRIGVGVLARKVNSNGTFGTVEWFENFDGSLTAPSPIPTYPSYNFNNVLRDKIKTEINSNPEKTLTWYQGVPITDTYNTEVIYGSDLLYEPSVCQLPNGQWLKLWRWQKSNSYKVAQFSTYGVSWGDINVTEVPDNPSKTTLLKSGDKILMVGNNQNTQRFALYLAVSTNGLDYNVNDIYNLDRDSNLISFSGAGKSQGCQYPSLIKMSNGKHACIYSIKKENIRFSTFDITQPQNILTEAGDTLITEDNNNLIIE